MGKSIARAKGGAFHLPALALMGLLKLATKAAIGLGGRIAIKKGLLAIGKFAAAKAARHAVRKAAMTASQLSLKGAVKAGKWALAKKITKKVGGYLAGKSAEVGAVYGITHLANKEMLKHLNSGPHGSQGEKDEGTVNRSSLMDYFPKVGKFMDNTSMRHGPDAAAHGSQSGGLTTDAKHRHNALSQAAGEGISRAILSKNKKTKKYIHKHSSLYKGRKDAHKHCLKVKHVKEKNNYGCHSSCRKKSKKNCRKNRY